MITAEFNCSEFGDSGEGRVLPMAAVDDAQLIDLPSALGFSSYNQTVSGELRCFSELSLLQALPAPLWSFGLYAVDGEDGIQHLQTALD